MIRAPEQLVRAFFEQVRSGRHPDRAGEFLAPLVRAHQLVSEDPISVERTPQEYAEHVREMQDVFGQFELEITELLAQGDRVYVRWKQTGRHLTVHEGFQPTGLPVVEIASAVYRVDHGKIVEYWIQIDRAGTEAQLERDARPATLSAS